MTREELVERIAFAVDGYRFGEWSLTDAGARIMKLIEANPDAALGAPVANGDTNIHLSDIPDLAASMRSQPCVVSAPTIEITKGAPAAREKPTSKCQDSNQHVCEVCGREGTRRYVQTETGWKCSPTATACAPKFLPPHGKTITQPPLPSTATVRALDEIAAPVAAEVIQKPDVTARCADCDRTWNLTGRVLKMAVDTHEMTRNHVVDVLETPEASTK